MEDEYIPSPQQGCEEYEALSGEEKVSVSTFHHLVCAELALIW